MPRQTRGERPQRLHPFEVVLEVCAGHEPVVLHSAVDANRATLAFHEQRQRLREQQIHGDLLLVQHTEVPRTLLRESLG